MPITNRLIRKIAEKDRIAFKKHSAIRMKERGIYADEVKNMESFISLQNYFTLFLTNKPICVYLCASVSHCCSKNDNDIREAK